MFSQAWDHLYGLIFGKGNALVLGLVCLLSAGLSFHNISDEKKLSNENDTTYRCLEGQVLYDSVLTTIICLTSILEIWNEIK